MVFFVVLLSVLCVLLATALAYSLRLNLQYQDKIESVSEQIEKSLDVLDTCYHRAAQRAGLEVFSDEPVVKELIEDIKETRDAILLVANLIIEPLQGEEEKDNEQDDK